MVKSQSIVRGAIVLGIVLAGSAVVELRDDRDADRRVVAAAQVGDPQAGTTTWAVTLRERNRSGRSGMAALIPAADGSTRVRLDLSGPPDTAFVTTIVVGTCSSPGEARFTLNPVSSGRSDTVIPIPLQELLNGKFSVRTAQAGDSTDLSCGEVVAG